MKIDASQHLRPSSSPAAPTGDQDHLPGTAASDDASGHSSPVTRARPDAGRTRAASFPPKPSSPDQEPDRPEADPAPAAPTSISQARLKANRENSKFSTGPKDTSRTRYNALKHGLAGKLPESVPENEISTSVYLRAYHQLMPLNVIEGDLIRQLIASRDREELLLDFQFKVFDGSEWWQIQNQTGDISRFQMLSQLARHTTHVTRINERAITELLKVRVEAWRGPSAIDIEQVRTAKALDATSPPIGITLLEACLADRRMALTGNARKEYVSYGRDLWETLRPKNLLEVYVACDLIRLNGQLQFPKSCEQYLLDHCGAAPELHTALESLREYERALQRRYHKYLALFRKIREAKWEQSISPLPNV